VKPNVATVVARFTDPDARTEAGEDAPWLVTMQSKKGRTVWIGSAELYRLRGYQRGYFDRFWLKLLRFAGEGGRKKQDRRGVALMSRDFSQGGVIRAKAQLFDPTLKPLPETATPKMLIRRLGPGAENEPAKVFLLTARKGAGDWEGIFEKQIPATAAEFPAGEYHVEIEIPGSSEKLELAIRVRAGDPETDVTSPDLVLLTEMSGEFKEIEGRIEDKKVADQLRRLIGSSQRLAFSIEDKEAIGLLPTAMPPSFDTHWGLGPVEDTWDDGPTIWGQEVSLLLMIMVGLLSIEWLTRKLLRLA
jgi:hypothetical protein